MTRPQSKERIFLNEGKMRREYVVLYRQEGDCYCLEAPAVGFLENLPLPGEILLPGAKIGSLTTIASTYTLRLPSSIGGKVGNYDTEHKKKAVGYAEFLFSVLPYAGEIKGEAEKQKVTNKETNGNFRIAAPSDGIFYRRPSPDLPCYVEVGSIVQKGQVLGLVEVMKCFNPIHFQGEGLPDCARVVEICTTDACEVKYKQNLFVFASV